MKEETNETICNISPTSKRFAGNTHSMDAIWGISLWAKSDVQVYSWCKILVV